MSFPKPPPASPAVRQGAYIPRQIPAFPDPSLHNVVRKLGFVCALGVVYIRYSLLHEVLTFYGGTNTKVLYFFSIPAVLCVTLSGGWIRAFSERSGRYWLAFVLWLCITVPFSFWRGESFQYAWDYIRVELPMFLFLAGLPMTWKECRTVFYVIAFAGITSISFFRLSSADYAGRAGLAFGLLANPNDYACGLLLVLPFIAFLVLRPMKILLPGQKAIQLLGMAAIIFALYLILATGSRGALVGILACAVFVLLRAGKGVRIGLIVAVPVIAAGLVVELPRTTLQRLESYSTDMKNPTDGTAESAAMRSRLLWFSLVDTITHPVFGVGPGQFASYEGATKTHQQGGYTNTHNAYTQISSETGLPGLFFYLAGAISGFLLLSRTWKLARKTPEMKEIAVACFCLSVSFVGYCVSVFFLNFGYFFYLPAFSGLMIAVSAAAGREAAAIAAARTQPQPVAVAGISPRRMTNTSPPVRRPAPSRLGIKGSS